MIIFIINSRHNYLQQYKKYKFKRMIEYYRIPNKTKNISSKEILTITDQRELKDAVYNKSLLSIKMLNMKNSNINDGTVGILWTITQPLSLISINLAQNFSFITDAAVDNLCQAEQMRDLRQLNLADNSITNEALRRISKASNMMKLQELILYGNSDISSEGLIYLGESQYVKNLRKLDLHDTSVCDKGLNFFIRTENSAQLQYLNVSMNSKKVTDHTCKAIANSKFATNLKQFRAQDCSITDEGISSLCESQNCEKLEVLDLNNSINKKNNLISDLALESIAFSKYVKKLKVLQLRNTDITSKGINTMSVSLGSENLQTLRLSYCLGVKDDAKRYLQSIIEYRSLKKLYLNSTLITKQIAEAMGQKYPNLNVIF